MKRIRFGIRLRLPFGLFKNAGIFVIRGTEKQAEDLNNAFQTFRLILGGIDSGVANDLVFEVE